MMTSCSAKQDSPTGNITPLNINSEEHIKYVMGQMLYVGIGTDKNTSKALQWLLISEEISERVYKDRYSNNIDIQSMHPLQENQLYKDIVALSKTVASELSEDDINMARENALKWLKKNP